MHRITTSSKQRQLTMLVTQGKSSTAAKWISYTLLCTKPYLWSFLVYMLQEKQGLLTMNVNSMLKQTFSIIKNMDE